MTPGSRYWLYMFRWRKAHLQAWPNHENCCGFMAWTYTKRSHRNYSY